LKFNGSKSDSKFAGGVVGVDALGEGELGFVAEGFAGEGEIAFGPVLGEAVGIVEIVGLEIGFQDAIEFGGEFVEGIGSAGAGVEDAGGLGVHGEEVGVDDVVNVDEIAVLLAGGEDAGAFAGTHLLGELVDHAGEAAFVGFAGAVDVGVAEADDGIGEFGGVAGGEAFHANFGECVAIEGIVGLGFGHGGLGAAVDAATAGPDDAGFALDGPVQDGAEGFDIVEQHAVGVIDCGAVGGDDAGNAGLVEDDVEGAEIAHGLDVIALAEGEEIAGEIGEVGPGGAEEGIGGDDVVAVASEPSSEIRTDKTSRTSNQYPHGNLQFIFGGL
jgi:hypothetical protein